MKNYHGDLDYTKIRNCFTPLNEKEFAYCENDCLVLYYYIKFEKEHNFDVPLTYTGHVRQELKSKLNKSYNIKVKNRGTEQTVKVLSAFDCRTYLCVI